jgi:hypothetical protein
VVDALSLSALALADAKGPLVPLASPRCMPLGHVQQTSPVSGKRRVKAPSSPGTPSRLLPISMSRTSSVPDYGLPEGIKAQSLPSALPSSQDALLANLSSMLQGSYAVVLAPVDGLPTHIRKPRAVGASAMAAKVGFHAAFAAAKARDAAATYVAAALGKKAARAAARTAHKAISQACLVAKAAAKSANHLANKAVKAAKRAAKLAAKNAAAGAAAQATVAAASGAGAVTAADTAAVDAIAIAASMADTAAAAAAVAAGVATCSSAAANVMAEEAVEAAQAARQEAARLAAADAAAHATTAAMLAAVAAEQFAEEALRAAENPMPLFMPANDQPPTQADISALKNFPPKLAQMMLASDGRLSPVLGAELLRFLNLPSEASEVADGSSFVSVTLGTREYSCGGPGFLANTGEVHVFGSSFNSSPSLDTAAISAGGKPTSDPDDESVPGGEPRRNVSMLLDDGHGRRYSLERTTQAADNRDACPLSPATGEQIVMFLKISDDCLREQLEAAEKLEQALLASGTMFGWVQWAVRAVDENPELEALVTKLQALVTAAFRAIPATVNALMQDDAWSAAGAPLCLDDTAKAMHPHLQLPSLAPPGDNDAASWTNGIRAAAQLLCAVAAAAGDDGSDMGGLMVSDDLPLAGPGPVALRAQGLCFASRSPALSTLCALWRPALHHPSNPAGSTLAQWMRMVLPLAPVDASGVNPARDAPRMLIGSEHLPLLHAPCFASLLTPAAKAPLLQLHAATPAEYQVALHSRLDRCLLGGQGASDGDLESQLQVPRRVALPVSRENPAAAMRAAQLAIGAALQQQTDGDDNGNDADRPRFSMLEISPSFESQHGGKFVEGQRVEAGEGQGPRKEFFSLMASAATQMWDSKQAQPLQALLQAAMQDAVQQILGREHVDVQVRINASGKEGTPLLTLAAVVEVSDEVGDAVRVAAVAAAAAADAKHKSSQKRERKKLKSFLREQRKQRLAEEAAARDTEAVSAAEVEGRDTKAEEGVREPKDEDDDTQAGIAKLADGLQTTEDLAGAAADAAASAIIPLHHMLLKALGAHVCVGSELHIPSHDHQAIKRVVCVFPLATLERMTSETMGTEKCAVRVQLDSQLEADISTNRKGAKTTTIDDSRENAEAPDILMRPRARLPPLFEYHRGTETNWFSQASVTAHSTGACGCEPWQRNWSGRVGKQHERGQIGGERMRRCGCPCSRCRQKWHVRAATDTTNPTPLRSPRRHQEPRPVSRSSRGDSSAPHIDCSTDGVSFSGEGFASRYRFFGALLALAVGNRCELPLALPELFFLRLLADGPSEAEADSEDDAESDDESDYEQDLTVCVCSCSGGYYRPYTPTVADALAFDPEMHPALHAGEGGQRPRRRSSSDRMLRKAMHRAMVSGTDWQMRCVRYGFFSMLPAGRACLARAGLGVLSGVRGVNLDGGAGPSRFSWRQAAFELRDIIGGRSASEDGGDFDIEAEFLVALPSELRKPVNRRWVCIPPFFNTHACWSRTHAPMYCPPGFWLHSDGPYAGYRRH